MNLFSSHSGELPRHSEIQKSTKVTTSVWMVWKAWLFTGSVVSGAYVIGQ